MGHSHTLDCPIEATAFSLPILCYITMSRGVECTGYHIAWYVMYGTLWLDAKWVDVCSGLSHVNVTLICPAVYIMVGHPAREHAALRCKCDDTLSTPVPQGHVRVTLSGHTAIVLCVDAKPTPYGGIIIASGSEDHTVRVWGGTDGECLQVWLGLLSITLHSFLSVTLSLLLHLVFGCCSLQWYG